MAREDMLEGKTRRVKTGCGWLYVTLNFQDGKPFETFVSMGKNGGCATAQVQALGLLASLCLRNGVDIKELIRETRGIGCHVPLNGVLSCADGFAQLLGIMIDEDNVVENVQGNPKKGFGGLTPSFKGLIAERDIMVG